MSGSAFEIIERPDGQFTLRHYKSDQTNDHGPFSSRKAAEQAMKRVIHPAVYHYDVDGNYID